jgi:superfamily I DNA/RNA helicase
MKKGECQTCHKKKAAKQPTNPTGSASDRSNGSGTPAPEKQKKMPGSNLTTPPSIPTSLTVHRIERTYGNGQQKLADRLRKTKDDGMDHSPHLIVEARAGTGKTTTLIEGLKRVQGMPSDLTPSPQQAEVWEAMGQSRGRAQTICFVAFNKSIATELQSRVPQGCDAMTMHSLGFKAVQKAFGRVSVNSYRVQDIISELLEKDIRELRRIKPEVIKAVEELVGLCKMNLCHNGEGTVCDGVQDSQQILSDLASYYEVDTNGHVIEIFDLVPRVLERCKDIARDGSIDFADMIWAPVCLGLPVYKYDLLLCDELQDFNPCQQQLAIRAGRRIIGCGDRFQSIYGFAGADCNSIPNMERLLGATDRGCVTLPLTVTRRCGKSIVREAQKIVPDFTAFDTNAEGSVSYARL